MTELTYFNSRSISIKTFRLRLKATQDKGKEFFDIFAFWRYNQVIPFKKREKHTEDYLIQSITLPKAE